MNRSDALKAMCIAHDVADGVGNPHDYLYDTMSDANAKMDHAPNSQRQQLKHWYASAVKWAQYSDDTNYRITDTPNRIKVTDDDGSIVTDAFQSTNEQKLETRKAEFEILKFQSGIKVIQDKWNEKTNRMAALGLALSELQQRCEHFDSNPA